MINLEKVKQEKCQFPLLRRPASAPYFHPLFSIFKIPPLRGRYLNFPPFKKRWWWQGGGGSKLCQLEFFTKALCWEYYSQAKNLVVILSNNLILSSKVEKTEETWKRGIKKLDSYFAIISKFYLFFHSSLFQSEDSI